MKEPKKFVVQLIVASLAEEDENFISHIQNTWTIREFTDCADAHVCHGALQSFLVAADILTERIEQLNISMKAGGRK